MQEVTYSTYHKIYSSTVYTQSILVLFVLMHTSLSLHNQHCFQHSALNYTLFSCHFHILHKVHANPYNLVLETSSVQITIKDVE